MNVSFIIYFHSSRLDNLQQTLRFLKARESDLMNGELILICQDKCEDIPNPFTSSTQINLNSTSYRKPLMCNIGVEKASNECIVILDSDRILPHQYFTKNLKELSDGKAITALNLYWLNKPYSDEEIEENRVEKTPDFKSIAVKPGKKNLFAGNTLMMKSDYVRCGGMDESFIGYGYADNDMTRNVIRKGIQAIYNSSEELHLWHPPAVVWNGLNLERQIFRIQSATNALRYNKKWNFPMDEVQRKLIRDIKDTKTIYPDQLWFEFEKMLPPKY